MTDIIQNDKPAEMPAITEHTEVNEAVMKAGIFMLLIPLIAASLFLFGILTVREHASLQYKLNADEHELIFKNENYKFPAVLAGSTQYTTHLLDTVYTNDDLWLEMRIDQQMLYVHHRDGRLTKYPISSGIPGAHKSVESRSGLFAIFHRAEVHLSSQFNSAQLNYFQPFNMGVGFHGLQGTGYYVYLGVRPSSHGCIRMRNDHAKELYKMTNIGTLVLAHKGESARVIAFAPVGFKDTAKYDKENSMKLLAYNLNSIYSGKYFIENPRRFIIDGKVIPKNGFNVGNKKDISDEQIIPKLVVNYDLTNDLITYTMPAPDAIASLPDDIADKFTEAGDFTHDSFHDVYVDEEVINKLAFNKQGILPYFPPDQPVYDSFDDSY